MKCDKKLSLAILNYAEGRISISGQHEELIVVKKDGQVQRIDTIDLGFPIELDDDIADLINHELLELEPGGVGLIGVGFLQLGGVTSIKGIYRSVREGSPTLKMNGSIVE